MLHFLTKPMIKSYVSETAAMVWCNGNKKITEESKLQTMATAEELEQFERAVLNTNLDNDWNYLSEGNKHIVFECKKQDGILESLVLNINKDPNDFEEIFASNYIVQKWLGDKYVNNRIYHPIHLSQTFVFELIGKNQDKRPIKRREKHPFQRMGGNLVYNASLEDNACSLPIKPLSKKPQLSRDNDENIKEQKSESKENEIIEGVVTFDMKPKWMFLNVSPFIDDDNIKKNICRFSMHQQLKFNVSKSIKSVSKYCPLSLLSGNIDIIATNIEYLLNAKQTNIKLFHKNKEIKSYLSIKKQDIKTVARIIAKHNDLFKRISMLQRLDKLDIVVINKIWNELKLRNKLEMINQTMKNKKILDEILNELNVEFNKTEFDKEKCCNCNDIEGIKKIIKNHNKLKQDETKIDEFVSNLSDKKLLVYVSEYLLSSIFKDCQVLITIDFNNIDNYKITLIDLHSKPMNRIENKWLKQDKQIIENYIDLSF